MAQDVTMAPSVVFKNCCVLYNILFYNFVKQGSNFVNYGHQTLLNALNFDLYIFLNILTGLLHHYPSLNYPGTQEGEGVTGEGQAIMDSYQQTSVGHLQCIIWPNLPTYHRILAPYGTSL